MAKKKLIDGEEVTLAKIKFVPSIGLGNIITIIGMIVFGSMVWFGLVSKVDATAAATARQDQLIERLASQAGETRERVGKVEVAVTFIAPSLQRIEDKLAARK